MSSLNSNYNIKLNICPIVFASPEHSIHRAITIYKPYRALFSETFLLSNHMFRNISPGPNNNVFATVHTISVGIHLCWYQCIYIANQRDTTHFPPHILKGKFLEIFLDILAFIYFQRNIPRARSVDSVLTIHMVCCTRQYFYYYAKRTQVVRRAMYT